MTARTPGECIPTHLHGEPHHQTSNGSHPGQNLSMPQFWPGDGERRTARLQTNADQPRIHHVVATKMRRWFCKIRTFCWGPCNLAESLFGAAQFGRILQFALSRPVRSGAQMPPCHTWPVFGDCRGRCRPVAQRPTTRTRPACGAVWGPRGQPGGRGPKSAKSYRFSAKFPRSAFLKRESFPLLLISRRIAE